MWLAAIAVALLGSVSGPGQAAGCSVDVDGRIEYGAKTDLGLPRSNPDGTVYPGDAFLYEFEYRFSGGCVSPMVHGVESAGAAADASGNGPQHVGGSGSVSGLAEILVPEAVSCTGKGGSWSASPVTDCGYLGMRASAKEKRCSTDRAGVTRCWYVTRSDSDRVYPRVAAPAVGVSLDIIPALDPDGYEAQNRDGTRYPWDPVIVGHAAEFKWADERAGTITFLYSRMHGPLAEESGEECGRPCAISLSPASPPLGIGFLPVDVAAGNGGGAYAYTALSGDDAGVHGIVYGVAVHNLGREISSGSGSAEVAVVPYLPLFRHYSYTVFSDGRQWAYDDGQGIAVQYLGSAGPDPDNPVVHPQRRSKINGLDAYTVIAPEHGRDSDRIRTAGLLSWHSAGAYPDGSDHFSTLGGHAMFYGAGYGVIRYVQDLTDILNSTLRHTHKEAVTVGLLHSVRWAGEESVPLFRYTYEYPHAVAGRWVNATSDDPSLPISITEIAGDGAGPPPWPRDGFFDVLLDDYLAAKALRDTGDASIADIVSGDAYPMGNGASGTGSAHLWANRITLRLSERAAALDGYGDVLDMSVHEAMRLPGVARYEVRAGEGSRNVTLPWEYEGGYRETILTGLSEAEHRRVGQDMVHFRVPEGFGPVTRMEVDGAPAAFRGGLCEEWCAVRAGGLPVAVRAYNAYGGVAWFAADAAPAASAGSSGDILGYGEARVVYLLAAVSAATYASARAVARIRGST